jgi:ceramide glucosyltransferase
MIFVFYFFAATLVWLSFKSFAGGVKYLRYFREQLARPASIFKPFVTIIAPCKGLDEGFKENIAALFDQEYPGFEIVFVVGDADDPAAVAIRQEISRRDAETQSGTNDLSASLRLYGKLIVAPSAVRSSQKVENLREAVLHADQRSETFVFVDSDARPSKTWLRDLVAPLADEKVGAATGYRWFISEYPMFGSEMLSAWNASIASALGANTSSNFCWGGSTAIRRETFERLGIREKWLGTLSDDFTVTRIVKSAGLNIVFVPQALTASIQRCSLRELIEFTNRQMKITRVYATPLWAMSLVGSALFSGVMIAALLIVLFSRTNSLQVSISIAVLVLVTFFSVGKSWLRLKAVRLVLTNYQSELRRQSWTQNTLWLFAPALFLINSIAALFSRRITWRGITYELKSPTETVIISD